MNKQAVLPCPFCGNEPWEDYLAFGSENPRQVVYGCKQCNISMLPERWNRRALPESPAEAVDAPNDISLLMDRNAWRSALIGLCDKETYSPLEAAAYVRTRIGKYSQERTGWVLVPKEPTEAMLFASASALGAATYEQRESIYRCMIAAAPADMESE